MMQHFELNLDGLVGPTHHYAGLSDGNIASLQHARTEANPKAAALQGLKKMRYLHQQGFKQALMPPHERPNLSLLNQLGFNGPVEKILKSAYEEAPALLSAAFSASCMWTANAATVTPALDVDTHTVHFTPANLVTNLHRQQECDFTAKQLKLIFNDERYFTHHAPLPYSAALGDEGAANHNRFAPDVKSPGFHLFVYGKIALSTIRHPIPIRYPARQTLEASRSIARTHGLSQDKVMFVQQNPQAVDLGVFHNDVISVANQNLFFVHQDAFVNQQDVLTRLKERLPYLNIVEVPSTLISIEDAVKSYLFNSQLLSASPSGDDMLLLAPVEAAENPAVKGYLDILLENKEQPIRNIYYHDLRQSMKNGGGPACLRLRVLLSEEALLAMHQGVLMDDDKLDRIEAWVHKHYRDRLNIEDLVDRALILEVHTALDELTTILGLGSIYPFQR